MKKMGVFKKIVRRSMRRRCEGKEVGGKWLCYVEGANFAACALIFFEYSDLFLTKSCAAAEFAGLKGLGVSSMSCSPIKICFNLMAGRQPFLFSSFSSFKMLRQT